jgi:hypothetical protein
LRHVFDIFTLYVFNISYFLKKVNYSSLKGKRIVKIPLAFNTAFELSVSILSGKTQVREKGPQ